MTKQVIPYQTTLDYIDTLKFKLKTSMKPLDCVAGITRGGLIPAVYLSHELGVPMETVMWQTRDGGIKVVNKFIKRNYLDKGKYVVFVDEINDSGTTFEGIKNSFDKSYHKQLTFASLVRRSTSKFDEDIYAEIIENDRWLVFPWEKKGII